MSESLPESAEVSAIDLSVPQPGPKRTTSLKVRRSPVAAARYQIETLNALDLEQQAYRGDFRAAMNHVTEDGLRTADVEILQLNLGKLCNMTCRHCHVDAGPDRWREVMGRETAESCVAALDRLPAVTTVDLTGGAPELNPHFRYLVEACVERGKHVIDRCNLTVLLVQNCRDLPEWMAERGVEVVCSLPHYRRRNTDAQRGDGTFEKSIEALRRLNEAGYGQGDPKRRLTVMVNPVGALLTGCQSSIEREWKAGLERHHGLSFDRLISLNNMPIARFLEWLLESGNLVEYMELLVRSFNPATVDGLMCRNTLSVSWDGRLYDCDFNQMLELDSRGEGGARIALEDLAPEALKNREIAVGRHCFGCTAGAGSSCGGALDE